jgi:hypothetical protein
MVAWRTLACRASCSRTELAPMHRRIAALEQSNRDTRLLVLDRRLVARQSARHALAGNACAFG